jgi:hypothetical protein
MERIWTEKAIMQIEAITYCGQTSACAETLLPVQVFLMVLK